MPGEAQTETWAEFIEHQLHHIKEDTGITIGISVIVLAAGYFILKLVRAWKGKT